MSACQLKREEVAEQGEAGGGENGFGVELDAFDGKLAVAEAHDDAVGGFGGDFEAARQRAAFHDERMVARSFEILREAAKNRSAVVVNFAGFAVHDFFRADDFAAERVADGLMAEANAENGNFSGETLDDGHAQAGFARRAGAGRNNDALGTHARDFVESDFVVAADGEFLPQLAEVLRQVVGEGVVVVEQQEHFRKRDAKFSRTLNSINFEYIARIKRAKGKNHQLLYCRG